MRLVGALVVSLAAVSWVPVPSCAALPWASPGSAGSHASYSTGSPRYPGPADPGASKPPGCPASQADAPPGRPARPGFTWLNKFAAGVVQDGAYRAAADAAVHTVWRHGLKGEGQVVGIGDGGVNFDSCFLTDPAHAVPINRVSATHRKFAAYLNFSHPGQSLFADRLHGTHTATTIAGDASDPTMGQYQGMAPHARLAFVEFSLPVDSSGPVDLETHLDAAYAAGARIYVITWGSYAYGTDLDAQADSFAYAHPDMLLIAAAGDLGVQHDPASHQDPGMYSIAIPATCKNVLTVGASMNAWQAVASLLPQRLTLQAVLANGSPAAELEVTPARFGPSYRVLAHPTATLPLAIADPLDGCCPSRLSSACLDVNGTAYRGALLLLWDGGCALTEKLRAAHAAGAVGLVVVAETPAQLQSLDLDAPDLALQYGLPVGILGLDDGSTLLASVQGGAATAVLEAALPDLADNPRLGAETVAVGSSRGPTFDSRIKPDVLAPGAPILSADGSQPCAVAARSGTSSSAAVVAGAAALVRQYFTEGYYPMGYADPGHGFPPSAMLLKAMLVTGATPLTGLVDDTGRGAWRPLPEHPLRRMIEGHGLINLGRILPFADANNSRRLYVQQSLWLVTGQIQVVCFDVAADVSVGFTATIAWLDTPQMTGDLACDLDLVVLKPDGSVFLGNGLEYGPDNITFPDDENNVERVLLSASQTPPGRYTVAVLARRVPAAMPPPFALVVTWAGGDPREGLGACPAPAGLATGLWCPTPCLHGGVCRDWACHCPEGFSGPQCEAPVVVVDSAGPAVEAVVPAQQWRFFAVRIPPTGRPQAVHITATNTGRGDPDYYVQLGRLPTDEDFLLANSSCDNCGHSATTVTRLVVTQPCPLNTVCSDPTLPGGWLYLGVFSSQCSAAAITVAATVVSCSAACNSLEAPEDPACLPQCGQLLGTPKLGRLTGYWRLSDTVPCARQDCAVQCRERCPAASDTVRGTCSLDKDVDMCECFATFSTTDPTVYDCLLQGCTEAVGFTGPFVGGLCPAVHGAGPAGSWAPIVAVGALMGLLVVGALTLVASPRARKAAAGLVAPRPGRSAADTAALREMDSLAEGRAGDDP
eukprot:EG_transcript_1136